MQETWIILSNKDYHFIAMLIETALNMVLPLILFIFEQYCSAFLHPIKAEYCWQLWTVLAIRHCLMLFYYMRSVCSWVACCYVQGAFYRRVQLAFLNRHVVPFTNHFSLNKFFDQLETCYHAIIHCFITILVFCQWFINNISNISFIPTNNLHEYDYYNLSKFR